MDLNIPHCQDAILQRSQGKSLDELDDSDRSDLVAADVNPEAGIAELHCQVEGCSKVQFAVLIGGSILALNSRFKPEHYPCQNSRIGKSKA